MATPKITQLQLRVTPREKSAIRAAAAQAGMDMSTWILATLLPQPRVRMSEIYQELARSDALVRKRVFAALHDLIAGCDERSLRDISNMAPPSNLDAFTTNYVAAMMEFACHARKMIAPTWTGHILPLAEPYFGSTLASLRLYLLRVSPAPFKSRNIFIDAS